MLTSRSRCRDLGAMKPGPLRLLAALALALSPTFATAAPTAPGLALTASDGTVRIHRFGASPSLYLAPGESVHPSLSPERTELVFEGFLAVESADRYRFRAAVEGEFSLDAEGFPALSLRAKDATAATAEEGVAIEPRLVPLRLRLAATTPSGARRLRLEWRSTRFDWEPVPLASLRHEKDAALAAERATLDRGRFLVDEAGCAGCHPTGGRPALASLLETRSAPELTRVGSHARAEWIAKWLEHPASVRPGTAMPRLFPKTPEAAAERAAIARFLAGLDAETREGPPPRVSGGSGGALDDAAAGEALFFSAGCVGCHDPFSRKFERTRAPVPIDGAGSQSTAAGWAHYLMDPLRHDPSGRMPDLALSAAEARSIAAYLATSRDSGLENPLPEADPRDGARLVRERACLSCHSIEGFDAPPPPGRPIADLDLASKTGCLSPGEPSGRSPRYDFAEADRDAVRAFLVSAEARATASAASPLEDARVRVERLRCDACHDQADRASELSRIVVATRGEAPREAMQPPSLAGVGAKLRGDWLRTVLLGTGDAGAVSGRARPWLSLRMPRFGETNASLLHAGLLARDGFAPGDDEAPREPRPERVMTGRALLSPERLSCVSCHDMAGVPGSGSRGPEVLRFTARLRRSFFERWMLAPQRVKPATEMPTYFSGGRSLVTEIDGGDARAQIAAIWDYLSLGMKAPLPEGLTAPSGISLSPKDAPLVVRTPLGERARVVAVGFPGGVSVGVEAGDEPGVRLFWDGGFLRLNGTQWTGQHGPYPEIEGRLLAEMPDGFAWAVGTEVAGPARFRGYRVAKEGTPTFLYDLPLPGGVVRVEESLAPAAAGPAAGVAREIRLSPLPPERALDGVLFASASALAVFDARGTALGPGARVPLERSPFVEIVMSDGRRAFVVARSAPQAAAFAIREAPLAVRLVAPPGAATQAAVLTWTLFSSESDAAAARAALEAIR